MKINNKLYIGLSILLIACSCGQKSSTKPPANQVYEKLSPDFNADSAYHYVDTQVAFGSRVPNTKEHVVCGDYLVGEMKRFGAEVIEQKMVVTAYNGTKLNSRNIIASYNSENKNRVLLFAHWDSRPYSDWDANKENHNKPLLGANDGASGVGVLMEVARILNQQAPQVGVDIIFFDSEDYGPPRGSNNSAEHPWCLGSQYWAKNPHVPNYKAKYGILLDMVGTPDVKFYREDTSMYYAKDIVDKVWSTARQLGYGSYFIAKTQGGVVDDHTYVNQLAGIRSIDIIETDIESEKGFGYYWHTQADDMKTISKETLKAVGQTVLEVVYKEK